MISQFPLSPCPAEGSNSSNLASLPALGLSGLPLGHFPVQGFMFFIWYFAFPCGNNGARACFQMITMWSHPVSPCILLDQPDELIGSEVLPVNSKSMRSLKAAEKQEMDLMSNRKKFRAQQIRSLTWRGSHGSLPPDVGILVLSLPLEGDRTHFLP